MKLLLSQDDVAVNSPNRDYQTPLSLAAQNGHEAVVKLLLSRDDVAVNCWDQYARPPLLLAIQNGHEAIVKLLLSRDDVAIDYQNSYGQTPLLLAARNGHKAIVKLLKQEMRHPRYKSRNIRVADFLGDFDIQRKSKKVGLSKDFLLSRGSSSSNYYR